MMIPRDRASLMNWVCLYCAELNGAPWLFYGYATRADGLRPSTHWRRHQIGTFNGGVTLAEYQLAAEDDAVLAFRDNLAQASTTLTLANNQTVAVQHGGLISRPDVVSALPTADSAGVPVSLSDQITRTAAYWQIKPDSLLDAFTSHTALSANEREECLGRILNCISDATGIDLLGRDAGRFGNFEDMRYLLGSYDQPDGLRHRPERATDNAGASVLTWVEPPLSALSPLLVGCRLFNGHPRDGRTLVLDEVKRLPAPGSPPLRFTASEPISSYELSVWAEADGRLLARQDEWVLRHIDTNLAMNDPSRAVSTGWDRGLPVPLRQRVAAATGVSHSQIVVGGYKNDPWVRAEDQKRAVLHQLGPAAGPGRFFPAGDEHHVETILFLASMLNRHGVTKVLIADPYLDKTAINALLVRVREIPEVVLLSSHDRPDLRQAERRWKGSLKLTIHHWLVSIADWCLKPTTSPPEEPIAALIEACNQYRNALPTKVRVMNVSHADGKGQKFHDRNVVVELSSGAREVWSLTNSLSMGARRYPLLVTLVDPDVGRAVTDHLSQLQLGQAAGKPDLQSDVLWEKPAPHAARSLPAGPKMVPFQSGHRVVALLLPDISSTSRLSEALAQGLLEPDTAPGSTTWRVPAAMRAQVSAQLVNAVQSARDGTAELLHVLGEWAYHGGLGEPEYAFNAAFVPHAEAALRAVLRPAPAPVVSGPLDVSKPATFPECLNEIGLYINRNAPMDLEPRGLPGFQFLASILWRHAPDRLVAVAEEAGGSCITGWLAAEASNLTQAQSQALLRSGNGRVVSLGVTLLWDRTLNNLALSGARIAAIEAAMEAANISQFDRFLAELSLTVPGARSAAELEQSLAACIALAPGQLDGQSLEQLAGVLSTNGPFHSIVRVGALAHLIPTPAVAIQLHQWCIDKVTQNLHFRYAAVPERSSNSPSWDNVAVREAFARSYWQVHGNQTPARYIGDILQRLNFRAVDAPLYPTREYGKWSEQITALLWGMTLGVEVVNAASAADRATTIQTMLPELIRNLQEFRLGLWHRYGDFHGLLAALVETLSAWIDDPAARPADQKAWDNLLLRPIMPELWKLYGILRSNHLTQAHVADLPNWTLNPASSPSLCERPRLGPTRRYLAASFEARKAASPNLAADLDAARDTLLAWWDARYPTA